MQTSSDQCDGPDRCRRHTLLKHREGACGDLTADDCLAIAERVRATTGPLVNEARAAFMRGDCDVDPRAALAEAHEVVADYCSVLDQLAEAVRGQRDTLVALEAVVGAVVAPKRLVDHVWSAAACQSLAVAQARAIRSQHLSSAQVAAHFDALIEALTSLRAAS